MYILVVFCMYINFLLFMQFMLPYIYAMFVLNAFSHDYICHLTITKIKRRKECKNQMINKIKQLKFKKNKCNFTF
jgi:type IV secretory pathway VirB3-like protein